MNVPYKIISLQAGDSYLNLTAKKRSEVEPEEKPENEQKTLIELEVEGNNVNETVLDALAMLNKIFVHEYNSENSNANKELNSK